MKEIVLDKWKNININKIEDIENLNDIQRALLISENCIENALCFLKMTFPQPELAKKYFTEAIIIFNEIILPYKKESSVSQNTLEKIEKLEKLIKDIDIDI